MSAPVRTVTKNGRQQVERQENPDPAPSVPNVEEFADFMEKFLRGEYLSEAEAIRAKENALAFKHMLDGRKKAGDLIDAAAAQTVVYEEFQRFRDAWLNFPSRIGPLLAAEVGVEPERVVEALTAHVHQQLTDLGEPEPDFGLASDGENSPGGPPGPKTTAKD